MSETERAPQLPEQPIDPELQQDLNNLQTTYQEIDVRLQDANYDPRNYEGNNDIEKLEEVIQDTTELLDAMKGGSVAATRQAQNLRRQYVDPARRTLAAMRQRVTQLEEANKPQPEKKIGIPEDLKEFNALIKAVGIEPFSLKDETEEAYREERERLSRDICAKVIGWVEGKLGEKSVNFIPSNSAGLWTDITMKGVSISGNKSADLDVFVNNIPEEVVIKINGIEEKRPFLGDTAGYLVDLIKILIIEHDRAVALKSYADPVEYVSIINSAAFQKFSFGKDQLRDLMLKDGAAEKAKLTQQGTERNVDNSAYEAFRLIKQRFISMARFLEEPELTVEELDKFMRTVHVNNMYPLSLKQDAKEDRGAVAPPNVTFEWIHTDLRGKFSDEVIKLAFRWAIASNRTTGLEEYLDVTPGVKMDKQGNPIIKTYQDGAPIIKPKVMAARSATRLFHSEAWAKYSVEAKGSGRDPVAQILSEQRPAFGVIGERNWLVKVRLDNGKVEKRSMYEVYRDGLWDNVIDVKDVAEGEERGDFPGDPNNIYGRHLDNMAKGAYEIWFMGDKAPHILPDREKFAHYSSLPIPRRERRVSKTFQNEAKRNYLKMNEVEFILDRLYSKDSKKRLININDDALPDTKAPKILKDYADYAWDNTPLYEPNFKIMFRGPDGGEHPMIMEAVRKNDKGEFVMWNFMMLVMAELERYRIPHEELERAEREWNSGKINLLKPIETVSKQHPLHHGEREAIRRWLIEFQYGLPQEYKDWWFTLEMIDLMLENLGIENTAASKIADLQWITRSTVLRGQMEVFPGAIPFIDPLLDFVGYDV